MADTTSGPADFSFWAKLAQDCAEEAMKHLDYAIGEAKLQGVDVESLTHAHQQAGQLKETLQDIRGGN